MGNDSVKLYGEIAEERMIREKAMSRNIVKEILDFGVSERQKYVIIKLLAENLENFDDMKRICSLVDELTTVDLGVILDRTDDSVRRITGVNADIENG